MADFVIVHRPKNTTKAHKEHPAVTVVLQLSDVASGGDWDMRNEADARDLDAALAMIDEAAIESVVPSRNERAIRSKAHAERKVGSATRHKRWTAMRAGKGKKKPMSYGAIAKAEGVAQSTVFKVLNPKK